MKLPRGYLIIFFSLTMYNTCQNSTNLRWNQPKEDEGAQMTFTFVQKEWENP
jgi:hypothetical protein